jgi:hypothetical protein
LFDDGKLAHFHHQILFVVPIISFRTPIVLQPGEGLTPELTYFKNATKTVSFGLTSQDEMNIIFGYNY